MSIHIGDQTTRSGSQEQLLYRQQQHPNRQHQHQHQQQQQQQYQQSRSTISASLVPSASQLLYCALIIFLLVKYRRQRAENEARKLEAKLKRLSLKSMPTPPRMPLIGHLHLMRDYPKNPWDGFNAIREHYGNIVSLQMGVHKMVLISSIEYMNEALIRKGDTFADRPNFARHHIVFGGDKENSLALCNWSQTHRARRKFCKRGVVPNKLSARNQLLESIIKQTVDKFVGQLLTRGGLHDCGTEIASEGYHPATTSSRPPLRVTKNDLLFLTGDVFMKFLCDQEAAHEDKAYERFNRGCDFIFYDINQCYLLDFLPYLTSLGVGYFYLQQLKGVTDYCRYYIDDNIFEPRRQLHLESLRQCASNSFTSAYRPDDGDSYLNGDLLELADRQDADEAPPPPVREDDYLDSIIKEQISGATSMSLEDYKVGFADLLAGHAAVTNILMRLLGHLSLDPAMQEMIYEEAERTKLASLSQIPPLPVTEASLMEAMRLASSPIVPHVARDDTSLGDYFVPKGSALLFNCYNINLSPDLWQEPRQFNPQRFLVSTRNDQNEVSHRLSLPKYFMPFSVGQRQCLGYKMVETISVMAAANICARFRFRPNNEQLVKRLLEPKGSVALSPLEECFEFKFEPR